MGTHAASWAHTLYHGHTRCTHVVFGARCILLEQELIAEVKHVKKPKTFAGPRITRRTVIAGATLIPIAAIQGAPQAAKAAAPATVLSPDQRRILEAFIDRLVPKDELGPGA